MCKYFQFAGFVWSMLKQRKYFFCFEFELLRKEFMNNSDHITYFTVCRVLFTCSKHERSYFQFSSQEAKNGCVYLNLSLPLEHCVMLVTKYSIFAYWMLCNYLFEFLLLSDCYMKRSSQKQHFWSAYPFLNATTLWRK